MTLGAPIKLGSWLPDQPDHRGPSLITAQNVIPREDGFYGPARDFSPYATALPLPCLGATSTRTSTGAVVTFGGTAAALYKLGTDNSWADVSDTGGYSMVTGDRWGWASYGARLIAFGGVGVPTQSWNLSTGAAFAAIPAAPNAKYGAVIGDFLMLANTYDATDQGQPERIWWSAKGDPESWPEVGTEAAISVQSSYRTLPDGGTLMGLLGGVGGADGAVFGETRIWRVSYVGPLNVFQIDPIERVRGVYAAGSLVQVGRMAYYLAEDGWYSFDGAQSTPIGTAKWDQMFLDDLDDGYKDNIWGAVDAKNKNLIYAYPGTGNTDGLPNRQFVINYMTGDASIINLETEMLVTLTSQGYTLDSMDALGFNMDNLPFSLDSRVWAGGGTFVAGCDSSHQVGQFEGATLQADLTTSEWSDPNHNRIFINGVRPIGDTTNVQASLTYREEMGDDTPTASSAYTSRANNRICPQLVSTRYVRTNLRVPAGEAWSSLQSVQLDIQPDGDA